MIAVRRLAAAVLTVLLIAGLSLPVTLWAAMSGPATATAVDAGAPAADCGGCADASMNAATNAAMTEADCAAVCAGLVGLIPTEAGHGPWARSGFRAAAADSPRGRVSPPATSPPDSILG